MTGIFLKDDVVRKYELVRDEVKAKQPATWRLVTQLCEEVPEELSIETIWECGRFKPCYSNIKVAKGDQIANDLQGVNQFKFFDTIASDSWAIKMKSSGPKWRSNSNFILIGDDVRHFISSVARGGISSYLWRLYAIRNLAIALQDNTIIREMVYDLARADFSRNNFNTWTKKFSENVGRGWGVVTAYHMLTDLGLAVKPDLHLKRSAIQMGLLAPSVESSHPRELDHLINDHSVVSVVMKLASSITPTACGNQVEPNCRHALREVDKVLMEWSREGLARPL